MVSVDEAARMALDLPQVVEGDRHDNRTWSGRPDRLKGVTKRALREGIIDGWLACAPPKLADEYIST